MLVVKDSEHQQKLIWFVIIPSLWLCLISFVWHWNIFIQTKEIFKLFCLCVWFLLFLWIYLYLSEIIFFGIQFEMSFTFFVFVFGFLPSSSLILTEPAVFRALPWSTCDNKFCWNIDLVFQFTFFILFFSYRVLLEYWNNFSIWFFWNI